MLTYIPPHLSVFENTTGYLICGKSPEITMLNFKHFPTCNIFCIVTHSTLHQIFWTLHGVGLNLCLRIHLDKFAMWKQDDLRWKMKNIGFGGIGSRNPIPIASWADPPLAGLRGGSLIRISDFQHLLGQSVILYRLLSTHLVFFCYPPVLHSVADSRQLM